MKTRTFDCVEMKRKGAERIYEELKGKTVEEQVEYWRRGTEELKTWIERERAKESAREKKSVSA